MSKSLLVHAAGYATVACLCVAGTAQALPGSNTVNSGDIINGEVKRPDLAAGAVNSSKVADETLTGADVLDGSVQLGDLATDSVNGARVVNGSLSGADIASGSITGNDIASHTIGGIHVGADALNGLQVAEEFLNYTNAGCKTGLVHSYARVKGSASMPSQFTTSSTYIDNKHTCSVGNSAVLVRRTGIGVYEVVFDGDPAVVALATPHNGDGDSDNTIAVRKETSTAFLVVIRDQSGELDDGWFQIVTF